MTDQDSPAMGDIIKTARESAGLRQEDVASLAGVSIRSVQAWEKGDVAPNAARLAALSRVLPLLDVAAVVEAAGRLGDSDRPVC